jgi:hypothetical protein
MKTTTNTRSTNGTKDKHRSGDAKPAAPAVATEACSDGDRHAEIATAAYYLALARGFAPGAELDDWLCAERAVAESHGRPDA